jgi:MinD superfamily P-loop ATPase
MKQLLILSGKGGTGKTTVAGAFIRLSGASAYADCDVDAPNLHLLMSQSTAPERRDYYGLPKARINPELCRYCSRCRTNCRFDAIRVTDSAFKVDPYACEGCGVCQALCPAGAVTMVPAAAGETMLYRDENIVFSTAKLKMGSGTTGKLVAEVKKNLIQAAPEAAFAVIDGSPGIGCPVIASMSGAHLALIVAEPSVSGIGDMERILKTAQTFGVRTAVCVNKYDVSPENTGKIEAYCGENDLPFVGRIPYDIEAVRAVNSGRTIVDVDCRQGAAVREIYEKPCSCYKSG